MTNLKIKKTDFIEFNDNTVMAELDLEIDCAKCPNIARFGYINKIESNGIVLGQIKVSLCEKHFNEIPFSCLHKWVGIGALPFGNKSIKLMECEKCEKMEVSHDWKRVSKSGS